MSEPITGYAEGYYGRLLSWQERSQLLVTLNRLGLNTYYYAPKEDPLHRLHWRTPYDAQWRSDFKAFCEHAKHLEINVVAGVAPGLDFDFSHLPDGEDFNHLLHKCRTLLADGADAISILMDDIDDDYEQHRGEYAFEGHAHAALSNATAQALGVPSIWVTPRVYADELIPESEDYLPHFVGTLDEQHTVVYCGSDVVSEHVDTRVQVSLNNVAQQAGLCGVHSHRVIIWDNLYANDYCPRRLFIGPWQGRFGVQDVVLNPTGMPNTDALLLSVMARTLSACQEEGSDAIARTVWKQVLREHDVPDAFFLLAPYFYHPLTTLLCKMPSSFACGVGKPRYRANGIRLFSDLSTIY